MDFSNLSQYQNQVLQRLQFYFSYKGHHIYFDQKTRNYFVISNERIEPVFGNNLWLWMIQIDKLNIT